MMELKETETQRGAEDTLEEEQRDVRSETCPHLSSLKYLLSFYLYTFTKMKSVIHNKSKTLKI